MVVAALAAVVFAMVHRSLIDDSLITMAYARNLAFGLEWGLIAGVGAAGVVADTLLQRSRRRSGAVGGVE